MMSTSERRIRGRHRAMGKTVAGAFVVAVSVWIANASCDTGGSTRRVLVVNRSAYDVEVELGDPQRRSWQLLGRAKHRSTTTSDHLADEGPTWVFRFHYGGRKIGDLSVSRRSLARAQWRVEVPSWVEQRMRDLGFNPPPDS